MRLEPRKTIKEWEEVSIHAPAWGATLVEKENHYQYKVSIHAPAWGATKKEIEAIQSLYEFQSTHPHGVRLPVPISTSSLS